MPAWRLMNPVGCRQFSFCALQVQYGGVRKPSKVRGGPTADLVSVYALHFLLLLEFVLGCSVAPRSRMFLSTSPAVASALPARLFGATAFSAMSSSDLSTYPVANAVAASAAVPVAFAPVVIKTFPKECNDPLPAWITKSRTEKEAE
jgi:hypothetical protein